jgi:phosphatidylinositol alpha-mannosyltransferase
MTTAPAKPLRIAMISYYLPSGSKIGVGYQVHELATELTRRGHHVDVFSECPPVMGATYGHRHIQLSGRMRTFRFALALRREDFSSYDVLHAHGDDYWLWRRRVPRHIRTIHGSCFEEAIHIRGFGEKLRMVALGFSEVLASLVADETAVVSPRTRRWTPWVKRVIPNGVDAGRFRPDPSKRATVPTVLFVGTWQNRKRGGELAREFQSAVLTAMPEAKLEMVCRDAPADPGRGINVLGELTDAQLVEAYQRAWVFCLPSVYEGFGIPYAEAMVSGLPVVATPNIGARYVTDNGKAGVLSPLDDIGESLRDLLDNPARQRELTGLSIERGKLFTLERVVDEYEKLYAVPGDVVTLHDQSLA